MSYQQRLIWALGTGLAIAAVTALFVVYGWVSGNSESSAFGRWQAIVLISGAGALLVWYFSRDALEAGEAGSAATPALLWGVLSLVSLPFFSVGLFAVLSVVSFNYAYIVLSIGPVRSEARKAWLGAFLASVALVSGTVLCIVSSWRLWP
jgi:hypothetical protein